MIGPQSAWPWLPDGSVKKEMQRMTTTRSPITEAREALEDLLSGWKYIRSFHGDLYGVGWDRAQEKGEKALAALAAQESAPPVQAVGWMPIETAPKYAVYEDGDNHFGDYILIWYPGALSAVRARWWFTETKSNFIADGSFAVFPTHWMTLPAAPGPVSAPPASDAMREALQGLVSVIDAAGLLNLMRGVELGPTVWYVKANDALDAARAALTQTGDQT